MLDLLERQPEELERGLVVLRTDLELEVGRPVDALARDAAGRPVLVFATDPESDAELPVRVLATRAWLGTGLRMLARALPLPQLRWDLPPRYVVVGFDLGEGLLAQLSELVAGAVEAYRLRPFRIGGEHRVGVQPLLGAGEDGDSFRAPRGLSDPTARTLCTRLLDAVRCIEPGVAVEADRYSRTFVSGGQPLAEVRLHDGALEVRVPRDDEHGLRIVRVGAEAECTEAVDQIARRFLELSRRGGLTRLDSVPAADSARASAGLTLEGLRRAVDGSRQLSDQEYSILGEALDDA